MDYSSDSYNSSSSATSSQFAAYQELEENRATKPTASYYSSLHAVRRLPLKPMKKPIAPLPPMKPKVYKVDSVNFKQVVQRLTSAPEFQPNTPQEAVENAPAAQASRPSRRLEEVAPPALDLSSTALPLRFSPTNADPLLPQFLPSPGNFGELIASERRTCGAPSPLGLSFSPSSLAWCLSPLLSPGTLSYLD